MNNINFQIENIMNSFEKQTSLPELYLINHLKLELV